MRYAPAIVLLSLLSAVLSCSARSGDPESNNGAPPPGGKDKRISDLVNPDKEGHVDLVGTTQAVSGAVVIAVDTFDETRDGKGRGDIFVQDLGATKETPYAGINLFAPTFSPGNLRVSPGDVLDMRGVYQENTFIPSKPNPIVFPEGTVLVQLAQPTATFRYETAVPEPVDIDIADLGDFSKGRQWIGMLVRVKDATILKAPFASANGRVSADLTPGPDAFTFCGPNPAATLVNSLYPIEDLKLTANQKVKSITGVVLFFCNIQLAPRSAADIQLQ